MLTKTKINPVRNYYFILTFTFLTFISLVLIPKPYNIIIAVTLAVSAAISSLLFYEKKKREISGLIEVIKEIRNNSIKSAGDIQLGDYLGTLEDEIRLMFVKMQQDIEYLKKLERVRTEFLANVSHELRTPIFTVQGFIETLLDGAIDNPEVNKKFLEKANLHTQNLSNLVNDLIDISMIESGEMRLSFRYFNLLKFLTELKLEMEPIAQEKEIELILLPVREQLEVLGDKTRLKQVLVNLITNAVRYSDTGKIEIKALEEGNSVLISVKDTGIGINEADQQRIFERFYRVDKTRSKAAGGTGLGLAIVKHIVEAHGGKVNVKSRPGEGSEFSFRLKK
jgi:two-component system phosphate regulon sensor histidine kinase PhoR